MKKLRPMEVKLPKATKLIEDRESSSPLLKPMFFPLLRRAQWLEEF